MQLTIRKPAKSMLGSVPVDVAAKLLKIIAIIIADQKALIESSTP